MKCLLFSSEDFLQTPIETNQYDVMVNDHAVIKGVDVGA